jgi:hypothetical protein
MPASAVANLCTRCSACRHAISSRWRSAAALRVRTQVSSRAADTSGQMCWHLHSAVTWPPGRRVPRRHRILMCRYRWQWYRPCHGSNQRQRSTDGAARAVLLRQIFVNSNRACHRVFGAAEEPYAGRASVGGTDHPAAPRHLVCRMRQRGRPPARSPRASCQGCGISQRRLVRLHR